MVITNCDQRTLVIEGQPDPAREGHPDGGPRRHAGQAHLSRGPAHVHVARSARAPRDLLFVGEQIVQAAPSTWQFIEVINNQILTGDMYKALKEAKKLIVYEEGLLANASAAQTYRSVARQTSSPRELEASLLLQAAARLQSVHDGWDDERVQLNDALLYNRKLWSVFLAEMTDAEQSMPRDLRQNVANIGIFVMNQTVSVMWTPARAARPADQHQPRARRRVARPRLIQDRSQR